MPLFNPSAGGGGPTISADANSRSTGTINFSNANGVTFGLSNNGVMTASVGAAGAGLTNIKVSASDLSALRSDLTFADSNGVTFGLSNNGVITASVQTNYLTTAMLSNASTAFAGLGFTTATTGGVEVKGTLSTNGLSMRVPNYLTTAQPVGAYLTTARASNDAVGLNTAQTNVTWTVNSAGLSFNAGGYAGTGFTSTTTAGTEIKATHNTAGLSMAIPAYLTAGGAGGGIAVQGNGANGTATFSTGTLALHAGNNITLSTGAQAISIHGPSPGGGAGITKSRFNPFVEAEATNSALGQSSLHFHPVPDAQNFQFDRMIFDVFVTQGTQTNSSASATLSMWAGIYTRNGNTLSLLASTSTSAQAIKSGILQNSNYIGPRLLTVGWTTTITSPDLWMAIGSATASAGANLLTLQQYVASDIGINFSGQWGVASNATIQNILGMGFYTANTGAIPNSVAFSQINGTNSNAYRVPFYYFVSQTA
jgi:hypothetical protein